MVDKATKSSDAYGRMLLAHLETGEKLAEIIERDDDFIDYGSIPGYYFSEYKKWAAGEKAAINLARGRVLDIGCGAGRHALFLQEKGLDVTCIDISPGGVKVCKKRGVKKAMVRSVDDLSKFRPRSFDTVLMMGNNFGLVGDPRKALAVLDDLDRITSKDALIIAGTRNPYGTANPTHLAYHRLNKKRGRMPGHLTMRARFGNLIGDWFDYLLVSPNEMRLVLKDSGWRIRKLLGDLKANYFAVLEKKNRRRRLFFDSGSANFGHLDGEFPGQTDLLQPRGLLRH